MITNLKPFIIDQERIDEVMHLYQSGNSIKTIAEYLSWSFWTVLDIVYEHTDKKHDIQY